MPVAFNLTDQNERKRAIDWIEETRNEQRRADSKKQVEIFNDRIHQYVYEKLRGNFSENTVKEMPITSSVNLARRISKQEASIYREEPKRLFTELSEEQEEVVNLIYRDMRINDMMMKSNQSFKLQSQNHIMIVPKNGQLKMRVMRNHHLDSLDDAMDPEVAGGYVISTFDSFLFLEDFKSRNVPTGFIGPSKKLSTNKGDRFNQPIGDSDDPQTAFGRYVWWTPEFNYITNRSGEIISGEDVFNPLAEFGLMPIIDISLEKDFEYWVRQGESLTEFTVDYNAALTELGQIVKMQGFAQAWMKAPADLIPESIQVGPNHILKLVTDPDNPNSTEFGFSSPSPDIGGSIRYLELLLSNFLSSKGIDPKMVTGSADAQRFGSGIERFLAMLEKFEASKDDFAIYRRTEEKVYDLVKAWHNRLRETDLLDDKYKTVELPQESRVIVEFRQPELIQSPEDRINVWSRKIEEGLASRVDALMDLKGLSRDEAVQKLLEIEEDESFMMRDELAN